jgi:cation:H+ antiporter
MVDSIPIEDAQILSRDVLWMLVFAAAILPLILLTKRHKLQFKEGFFSSAALRRFYATSF